MDKEMKNQKNTIYYVCQWGHNRARAWSGTYLALFNALKKQTNLIEVGVKQKLSTRIKQILNRHTRFAKYGFSYEDIKSFDPWSHNIIPKEDADVLSFFEMDIPPKNRGYIYQDMCIDYIEKVILKDKFLKNCFRRNVSREIIEIRKRKQKEYYANCSGIFVMGKWLKKYMIEEMGINKDKIYYVGAGYDIDLKKYNPSKRQSNKLLFVGVDFERKAGPLVIEAFKILKKKYQNNAELYIVGPKKLKLKEDCEGIHFVGNVPGDKITEYYNRCDVLCMPSYLEPFGKVFVEALAYGMPVIARNTFAAPDFISNGENGFLITKDDKENLAEKMYEALHSENIKDYVKKDMSRIREYYSWEAVAGRINEVIGINANNQQK